MMLKGWTSLDVFRLSRIYATIKTMEEALGVHSLVEVDVAKRKIGCWKMKTMKIK